MTRQNMFYGGTRVNADRAVTANGVKLANMTSKGGGVKRLVQTKSGVALVGGAHSSHEMPMLKKRTCHYLLPALLVAVLINIPKFFEFRTEDAPTNSTMG